MEKLLLEHKFDLFDYMNEVNAVKENGYKFRFERYGMNFEFYLPHYEEDLLQHIIVNYANFYENVELDYLRKEIIPRDAVVLDIGANIGNHTVFFGKVCGAKRIYCFEPVHETYETLCENIELNGLDNIVTANNTALGSISGKAKIKYYDPKQIGSTQVEEAEDGDMQMARLDDYAFERIDFIKIDVETYEYNLLKGAKETFTKHSPIVFIEILEENFNKVNALLEEYGYSHIETVGVINHLYRKRR